jgi:hypothetical protein
VKQALAFSLFQDLHADRSPLRRVLGKTLTAGWQVLGIGTFQTGIPFTVYSGIQQTGFGLQGTDRPDQIAVPVLSTGRTVREDYFGQICKFVVYRSVSGFGRQVGAGNQSHTGPLHHCDDFRTPGKQAISPVKVLRRVSCGTVSPYPSRPPLPKRYPAEAPSSSAPEAGVLDPVWNASKTA